MSERNVEVVRGMWEAFLRGDAQAALGAFHPDVVWDGTNLPDGRVARGLHAVIEHVNGWAAQWEEWSVDLEQAIDAGDEVVVIMREKGRSKSGVQMDERHGELYTVSDGKIVTRRGFSDPGEALKAAGTSE